MLVYRYICKFIPPGHTYVYLRMHERAHLYAHIKDKSEKQSHEVRCRMLLWHNFVAVNMLQKKLTAAATKCLYVNTIRWRQNGLA